MLLRSLSVKLPNQLTTTVRGRGFSRDVSNVLYMLDRLHRPRPFAMPRFFLEPFPGRRPNLDDHLFEVLEEASRLMRPERMVRELEDLSRIVTRGLEDVPLKIKPQGQKESDAVADGQVAGEDAKFAVQVRATEFKPEEIAVKVRDGYVFVDAQKEEKDLENGTYKYHQISKKFLLPRNADEDSVRCEMTKDGFLRIQAELKPEPEDNARRIPIMNQPENVSETETETESKIKETSAKE